MKIAAKVLGSWGRSPHNDLMHIALFGGSFDPPHVAHQMACLYLLSTQSIDEVWMVPCFQHPFGKQSAMFSHRFQMCIRAVELLHPRVSVSDIEKELGGASYTLRTVKELKRRYPQHHFTVAIGEDVLSSQNQWYGFEELKTLVSFIVLGREGVHSPGTMPIPLKLPEISSTLIRELLQKGASPKDLIPQNVLRYIEEHQLYRV